MDRRGESDIEGGLRNVKAGWKEKEDGEISP